MNQRLHKQATTTPAVRKKIRESKEGIAVNARRYNIHYATAKKWYYRDHTEDLSSKRHNLLSSLGETEECLAVELRVRLGLSVDDIVEVMRRCFNKNFSRSAIYRCLKRNGVNRLPKEEAEKRRWQAFDVESEPGFLHLDVKYLTRLKGKRSYVYVAIDRATRYVFAKVCYDKKPATAKAFLQQVIADFPCPVRKVMTDNGFEFTDRCAGGVKSKPTGRHAFDVLCARHGIQHKLTGIRRPQTNGMVERFNRRISEALAAKAKITDNSGRNCFASHAERNAFIAKFVYNYNRTRLNCLGHKAPAQLLHNLAKSYIAVRQIIV